ncbi:MAG: iron chelate uptake ABC transporter family permease subunit [Actinobacteria bacterium]|nr:iron chelate uptake ABC transporter family permease subunit [Actinomycetota bacterium]
MKLAIAGKGGAGKTTIAGTLARQLARDGYEVLALDNDLNPNLSLTVGIPAERLADLPTMSPDVVRMVDGRLELAQTLDEIRSAHAMDAPDGVTVLVAAEPKAADTGCLGRMHIAMRNVVAAAPAAPDHICILDTEASTEHLKVGTAKHVDALYAVVEPYFKSLESGRRILALAHDLGIGRLALLGNKVRQDEVEVVQRFAQEHGLELEDDLPDEIDLDLGGWLTGEGPQPTTAEVLQLWQLLLDDPDAAPRPVKGVGGAAVEDAYDDLTDDEHDWWPTHGDTARAVLADAVRRLRGVLFLVASGLTAVSVVLAGPIAFVGLICPHLARLLQRDGYPA